VKTKKIKDTPIKETIKSTPKPKTKVTPAQSYEHNITITAKALMGNVELNASSNITINDKTTPEELLKHWERILVAINSLAEIQVNKKMNEE